MLADYNSGKDRNFNIILDPKIVAKQLELEGKRKLRTRETTDNKKVSKLYDREEPGICNVLLSQKELKDVIPTEIEIQ
nr:hypothetical protein [Tanacetum cinerariifolium]